MQRYPLIMSLVMILLVLSTMTTSAHAGGIDEATGVSLGNLAAIGIGVAVVGFTSASYVRGRRRGNGLRHGDHRER